MQRAKVWHSTRLSYTTPCPSLVPDAVCVTDGGVLGTNAVVLARERKQPLLRVAELPVATVSAPRLHSHQ